MMYFEAINKRIRYADLNWWHIKEGIKRLVKRCALNQNLFSGVVWFSKAGGSGVEKT